MSQSRPQVWCTRSLPDNYVSEALARGIELYSADFVKIQMLNDVELLQQLPQNPDPWVFTSQYAVQYFAMHESLKIENLTQRRAYCMEGKTSQLAINLGFDLRGTASNSQKLAACIGADALPSVTHVTTQQRLTVLENELRRMDIVYRTFEVYEKIDNPIQVKNLDALVVLSPSQLDTFLLMNQISPEIPVFCIGHTTAMAARNRGFQHIITAQEPSLNALMVAVFQYFN
jgi:uroporphyrinogen-III synthase